MKKFDSLKVIQTLFKIAEVLTRIAFVFCVIGFCGCAVGIIGLAFGAETLKLFGKSLSDYITEEGGSVAGIYAAMTAGLFIIAGQAVVLKFSQSYYERELADGTPFTKSGAKELFRLAIIEISVSVGTLILAAITYGIFNAVEPSTGEMSLSNSAAVSAGIGYLFMALIFHYGAEVREKADGVRNADIDDKASSCSDDGSRENHG